MKYKSKPLYTVIAIGALTLIGVGSFAVNVCQTLTSPIDGQALLAEKEERDLLSDSDYISKRANGLLNLYSQKCLVNDLEYSVGCQKYSKDYDSLIEVKGLFLEGEITKQEAYFRTDQILSSYSVSKAR